MTTTIIAFIVVLGILIFIHELGHFVVAKLSGVGVEVFSLGFGPRILWIKRGETEYRISIVPFGGYVKMVGESPDEELELSEDDQEVGELTEEDYRQREERKRMFEEEFKEKSFTLKSLPKRVAIVAAGSTMNILLALVLFPVIYMIGVNVPAYLDGPPEVGFVAPGEPADQAGLETGDLILRVDGNKISTWEDLQVAIGLKPDREVEVEFMRDGEVDRATLTPSQSKVGAGIGGFAPPAKPIIGVIAEDYPAQEAGLRSGDVVKAIDGVKIETWGEMETLIKTGDDEKVFLVQRGDETLNLNVTPRFHEELGYNIIGVGQQFEMITKRYGPIGAIKKGIGQAYDLTALLFKVLKGLVVREYSLKTLGGPIMIAQVAGQAAESGIVPLLTLIAFLSLQLGIINLFPIPALDGGFLMFFVLEYIRGKPISDKVVGTAQQVGFVILIAFMIIVTWNDILRLF